MTLGDQLAAQLPFLRRYARALTGSQPNGDALVKATLEAAIDDPALKAELGAGRVALYRAFNRVTASAQREPAPAGGAANEHEAGAQSRLQKVTPLGRQALLLTSLEEFTPAEAGEILGIDEAEVERLVREAISEIERESATRVLIIEDEPLISMQLEALVTSLGHEICGTAATRGQVQGIISMCRPGLVLADIQLADGSSGLDAVDDILGAMEVPVVFITAYPERLLTGCCREPTYLVTKPFKEATVRAAISQALFFGSPRPVA
jgi:DNA-directed RNA polymerase specialized sigma24 family protein/CheY-like chemotaxis protein